MVKYKKINLVLIFCLVIAFIAIITTKFLFFDYSFDKAVPIQAYEVDITCQGKGFGSDASITHFLPPNIVGQQISEENIKGNHSTYKIDMDNGNRILTSNFSKRDGKLKLSSSFLVKSKKVEFTLPRYLKRYEKQGPEYLEKYLSSTELIQKESPVIKSKAEELKLNEMDNVVSIIDKVFNYVNDSVNSADFAGETDAVLTCKLNKASCNGKSRLMVALLRNQGIPSRLAGGLILEEGSKRTTHQWVEVFIRNTWVPFCPLNGYYAQKPYNYLLFYRGDKVFFSHTKDIDFDYRFSISKKLVPREADMGGHKLLDIINIWSTFNKAGIPLNILSVILLIPLGAVVTVIFRNVVGLQTYGTFLPALIAYAFMGTGFLWGAIAFTLILLGGVAINQILSYLKLLHTPKLTVIMIFTVVSLLAMGMWGIKNGNSHIAKAFYFPLAILSITIERFFVISQERGLLKSFTILGWTLVVVGFCYIVMNSVYLRMMIVLFPETYLLVIAAALYFGHWTGLRLSEFIRFRHLIFNKGERTGDA